MYQCLLGEKSPKVITTILFKDKSSFIKYLSTNKLTKLLILLILSLPCDNASEDTHTYTPTGPLLSGEIVRQWPARNGVQGQVKPYQRLKNGS